VLVGIILAGLLSALTGWLWPEMGLPVFVMFLLSWGVKWINTIALERRHPELILSPGWKKVKVRYRPLELGNDEYEISLIIIGVPVGLFVAGLIGILSPASRWPVFFVVFGVWAALMLAGIVSALQKQ
jgi:hypothetical protein